MSKEPVKDLSVNSAAEPEAQASEDIERGTEIPEGSRVVTIIVNKGEVTEKVYQTPAGERITLKF
ncbi:MAG: hypothetical protein AB8B45_01265 [Prochlorococcus sp.]|jgi:hypothetical protein